MASPQFSLSPSLAPQQALHIGIFGLLFAVLASPYVINLTAKWFPSLGISEPGSQLTYCGLLFHAVVFMIFVYIFAQYGVGTA